jgi:hypothetical protein
VGEPMTAALDTRERAASLFGGATAGPAFGRPDPNFCHPRSGLCPMGLDTNPGLGAVAASWVRRYGSRSRSAEQMNLRQ